MKEITFQVAEIDFWKELIAKSKNLENNSEHSELPPLADGETNVYSFGILLLEIISGKLQYSEDQGPLINWVSIHWNRFLFVFIFRYGLSHTSYLQDQQKKWKSSKIHKYMLVHYDEEKEDYDSELRLLVCISWKMVSLRIT